MQKTSTADAAEWITFVWEDGSFSTFDIHRVQGIEFTDAV